MNRLSNAITRAMALTLTFSQSAFAKVCAVHNQEAEMGAGTLGQYLTLGVMLTLVTGIF
ncbi:MAG: hypothetical protein GWM98_26075, partial [Nitrospinaceae bacterium]|nr:hypothetical protein [Nitrospinaceae bacterium]NIS87753.1 hypothetical protein [Nitrospinaceae bacterium]NIT84623.1 hypothetical protein [Nitrospinaceae bacterium]NIU46802.1 hypothetical protein [Nitrospinaceae bacterium]NIU99004.1 hypothetical protein [Nitrospinaceae bacterium]